MPVLNELSNHTEANLIPGLQADHISAGSRLAQLLDRFARYYSGPAGDDISITHLTRQATGRFYRGFDTADRTSVEETVGHRVRWANVQEDVALAGTDIESNLGMTTRQLVANDAALSLSQFPRPSVIALFNLIATRLKQAAVAGENDKTRSLWGTTVFGDNTARMPEGLDKLFDETGSYHGLAVGDLGTFADDVGRHPWGTNPPNTNGDTERHRAQIFDNAGGGNRSVSKSVLDPACIEMSSAIPGLWLAPVHPTLFTTLSSEFDAQYDLPLGVDALSMKIKLIENQNCLYFSDTWAPTNEIRHLHVGTPGSDDGSFFPVYWQAPEQIDNEAFMADMMMLEGITSLEQLGGATRIPWYSQEWDRGRNSADAISSAIQLKYTYACTYRWKQFVVRDLQP